MKAIVAIQKDGGIGYENNLPWPKIKEDFQWFSKKTREGVSFGKPNTLLVGKTTFQSLPYLKDRTFIVVTNDDQLHKNRVWLDYDVIRPHTICENLDRESINKSYLIGGAKTYKIALPFCDELYITHVNGNYPADTFFPYSQNEINEMFPNNSLISEIEGGHKIVKYSKNVV